jgi:hypothetical protein
MKRHYRIELHGNATDGYHTNTFVLENGDCVMGSISPVTRTVLVTLKTKEGRTHLSRYTWETLGNAKYKLRKCLIQCGVKLKSETRKKRKATKYKDTDVTEEVTPVVTKQELPEIKQEVTLPDSVKDMLKAFQDKLKEKQDVA